MNGPIHYLCTAEHSYTLGIFAEYYARKCRDALRIVPYRALPFIRSFGPGTFILTDFDRLQPRAKERVTELANSLVDSGCRVLNHPARSLGRFALLRLLFEEGINGFNVYRPEEQDAVQRFPVFVRHECVHGKAETGLLHSADELAASLRRLRRGALAKELMIVEFGNRPEADGRYRKYASFRVGNTIYCQHCYASTDWWVKFTSSDLGEERKRELAAYVASNPHSDQLMAIFRTAGIEYGRADYCVVDGRVQIFEINTNPTVIQRGAGKLTDVTPYAERHDDAMMALAPQGAGPEATPNPVFAGGKEAALEDIHQGELAFVRERWALET